MNEITVDLCVICVHAQSCPALCSPMDFSPPGSSVTGLPREEYWSGLLFPSLGNLLTQGLNLASPESPASPALAGGSFTTEPPGKPLL